MSALMFLDLWRGLGRLRQRDNWTREQLEAHQAEALARLRAHAYANSPFYQRFHAGLTDRPLTELPVLTKAMVMEHFDELVTDRAILLDAVRDYLANLHPGEDRRFLGRYWVCATSGSTGRPGIFLFDREEWLAVLAGFGRAHEWAGLPVRLTHRMKMAAISSTAPQHMSTQAGGTLRGMGWWFPTLVMAANEPVASMVERLNAWQPEMMAAYASMARVLADEQLAGRLRIAPEFVMVGSEVVTPETRRLIAEAWGSQPFEAYGVTEAGELAAECTQHRGLHLYEDLALIEVVDERNRPAPPGEYGAKILISAFASCTQPLIRYEVSDSLRLATEPCPCGRPFALIDSIRGRVEEVLNFPAIADGEVAVQPLTFSNVLDTLPVSGWQVVQEGDGELTILLSGAPDGFADQAILGPLNDALAEQGALLPAIVVKQVPAIPQTAARKAPLIRAARRAA